MNFNEFQKFLWEQNPVGKEGFEGLVAQLLEKLTGQRFYLSLPGRQEGKDMASFGQIGNALAAECKRYKDSTSLDSDKLLAKFVASSLQFPPDLWMVVTTTRLGDQLHDQLKRQSWNSGIAYFSIDAKGDENSFLCALCAHAPEIVKNHLQNHLKNYQQHQANNIKAKFENIPSYTEDDLDAVQEYLENLSQRSDVQTQIDKLKQEFLAENIGYADWQVHQNNWLKEKFKDKQKSDAAFGQNLAVCDPNLQFIGRTSANLELNKWWTEWSKNQKPLVILGEEGDGKTWAVASWLAQQLKQEDFPPVVFLSATQVSTTEPLKLISDTLKRQLSEPRQDYWEKRLERWLNRSAEKSPIFILVLDGLNENLDFQWIQLINKLSVDNFKKIAILATCREVFWRERLSNSLKSSTLIYDLKSYDDTELKQALQQYQLERTDFSEKLLVYLRKPRYFDLAVRLRSQLNTEGDITIERLIYEDQRDKHSRKCGASQLLTHDEFQRVISNLAKEWQQNKPLTTEQITGKLSRNSKSHDILEELITGQILISEDEGWKINPRYLTLGLGLLLAYEVKRTSNQTEIEISEVIARHLEPNSDMDIKVSICGMALYHSLNKDDFSKIGRIVLFKNWIKGRNLNEGWKEIPAYLPLRPETYFDVAEWLWSSPVDNQQAQAAFMCGFLKYKSSLKVRNHLISAFQRWMGFISPDGHSGRHARGHDEQKLNESRHAVEKKLGQKAVLGEMTKFNYSFNIIEDDGLLRLNRLVLAVISHDDRLPYLSAIVTGVIAGTIMGTPDFHKELAWVFHRALDDIEPELLKKAEELLQFQEGTAQTSAWWLLEIFNSEQAQARCEQIPLEFHHIYPLKTWHDENPCAYPFFLWTIDNYKKCLEIMRGSADAFALKLKGVALDPKCTVPDWLTRHFMTAGTDINLEKVAREEHSTGEDKNLKDLEPALCAYQPKRYAELLRSLVYQLPTRPTDSWVYLGMLLYEHLLIMGQAEREIIYTTWDSAKAVEIPEERESRELNDFPEDIFFSCLLNTSNTSQQLRYIQERGDKISYFADHPPLLRVVEPQCYPQLVETLRKLQEQGHQHFDNLLRELPHSITHLDSSLREIILEIFEHGDFSTRAYCLETIFTVQDKGAIQAFLSKDWQARPLSQERYTENYWGSKLLCEFGTYLSFSEICDRVLPELLGCAVLHLRSIQEEVLAYAELLQSIWIKVSDQQKPMELTLESRLVEVELDILNHVDVFATWACHDDLPTRWSFKSWDKDWGGGINSMTSQEILATHAAMMNFKAKDRRRDEICNYVEKLANEQYYSLGNFWFLNSFTKDALAEVVDARPDFVEQWIVGALENPAIIAYCRSFYEALCHVLLQKQPEKGIELFRCLSANDSFKIIDKTTAIPLHLFSLFGVDRCQPIDEFRKQLLDKAIVDIELFEIVFLAQHGKQHDWLKQTIEDYLQSQLPFEKGLGIRLLGFMDTQEWVVEQLSEWINKPDSWLQNIAKHSQQYYYQRNQWACHWFEQFVTRDDDVDAWAAFRLFLHCADRRAWLWIANFDQQLRTRPQRLEYYRACQAMIPKAIERNEKELKLKELFIGSEVFENQLFPWMPQYSSCNATS